VIAVHDFLNGKRGCGEKSLTTDDATNERNAVALVEWTDRHVQLPSQPIEHHRMFGRH
jgi:hypothetical protein